MIYTIASKTHLALAARGVNPVLFLHGLRLAHEVELDSLVLDRVKTLLGDINLLAVGNDNGADGLASTAIKQRV